MNNEIQRIKKKLQEYSNELDNTSSQKINVLESEESDFEGSDFEESEEYKKFYENLYEKFDFDKDTKTKYDSNGFDKDGKHKDTGIFLKLI